MQRKDIQAQRIKDYFMQAAKEILKGEGLGAVSVRNIADRAGYSYATLYNYFTDIKDLIFLCVTDFQKECAQQVERDAKDHEPGTDRINAIAVSYILYFIQYPGVFELFFLERPSDICSNASKMEQIHGFLTRLCEKDWDWLIESQQIAPVHAHHLKDQLNYTVTGLLLFYLNRKQPEAFEDFMRTAELQITSILQAAEPETESSSGPIDI